MKKRINSLADGKRMVGGNGRRVAEVLKLDGLGTAGALRALFGADWVVHNGEYLEALSFYGDKFEKILTALCLAFNGHGVNKTQLKTALALAKEIIDHEDAMAGNCFVGRRKNQVPVPDRAADIARTVKKVAASLRSIGGKRKDKEASVDRVRGEIAGFLRARVSLPRIDNPLD